MGKHFETPKTGEASNHKAHKTLRDKLRKKRAQIKVHKKQKSQKKKQYNREEEKQLYFNKQENKAEPNKELKLAKIMKTIQKFINIYEDDLNEFYDLFATLDKGGKINISELENKELMKCLKKMFKYLPLTKEQGEYQKVENSCLQLETFIRLKVSQCIEDYLENGSRQGDSEDGSSGEENNQKKDKKKDKKDKKDNKDKKDKKDKKTKNEPKEDEEGTMMGPISIYKEGIVDTQPVAQGPSIPEEYREQMAKLFDQQLDELKRQKEEAPAQQQEDEFDQMFSMVKTRKEMKAPPKQLNQDIPEHLYAAGSAVLGQKVDIDYDEIDEYNRLHRPKKLIDMHKEMIQSRGPEENKQRQSFSRCKDFGKAKEGLMTNSTFFDFKSKMTKPQKTTQFL